MEFILFGNPTPEAPPPSAWRAPILASGRTPPRQRASAAEPPIGEEQSGSFYAPGSADVKWVSAFESAATMSSLSMTKGRRSPVIEAVSWRKAFFTHELYT